MQSATNNKILTPRPRGTLEQAHVSCAAPVQRVRTTPEKRRIRAHQEAMVAALQAEARA
jgi:hypothetical protein